MTANIKHAKEKTAEIAQDLQLAGAELHLTNTALERQLPESAKQGDVGRALEQNAAIENKVQEAAEELAEVKDLLEEEVAERTRLEKKIDRMEGEPGG
jgi:phosphoglycerate-specific signal transduction histidine kinase